MTVDALSYYSLTKVTFNSNPALCISVHTNLFLCFVISNNSLSICPPTHTLPLPSVSCHPSIRPSHWGERKDAACCPFSPASAKIATPPSLIRTQSKCAALGLKGRRGRPKHFKCTEPEDDKLTQHTAITSHRFINILMDKNISVSSV